MRTLTLLLVMMVGISSAEAQVKRLYQNTKLPSQQMVEKQTFTNPIVASATTLSSAAAGPTSAAAASITSFSAQPDMPRNIVITPGGTTGDIENCTITVSGTNIQNASISEDFVFLADATGAVTGNKAFKTVSSVSFPANCESGGFAATWDIGIGSKLGVKYCMESAGHIFFSTLNGAKEATAPTMAASSSAVGSNTATFNGTLNGSNDFELFFIQNFKCL